MLTFHLIPHTHWDREWYLPRAALVARLVPMMDDLLESLENDPEFRSFLLDGQTILVEDYLRVRPDQEDRVRALVRSGRLQVGPWYVLADELIPSAESLIRNLVGGSAARRLGARLDVMYSPDAFGHPAAWPALAREFGIEHGVLWRGLAPGPGDGDLFHWAAPDGRPVLLYQLPRAGYEIGADLPADAERLPEAWAPVRDAVLGRSRSPHVAVLVGADHHAAHPAIGRLRELIAELEPDAAVQVSRLDEFLRAAAGTAHSVPTIRGELRAASSYTWALQGVHGTRLPLKRRNARAELGLERFAEPLAALAQLASGRDRGPLVRHAWRTLVRCHFHDAIAGCAHDGVAQDVMRRLADVESTSREIARGSLHELAGHDPDAAREAGDSDPSLVLWNPIACRRAGGIAIADVTFFRRDILVGPPAGRVARSGSGFAPFSFMGMDGRTIPVQVIEQRRGQERIDAARHYPDQDVVDVVRVAFAAPELGGLAVAALTLGPEAAAPAPANPALAAGRRLSNGIIDVVVERDGSLSLTDRRSGEQYAGLLALESGGDAGDTYTFAAPERDRVVRARGPARTRVVANGPLVAIIEASWTELDASFRLLVQLHAGESIVRIGLDIDNRAVDRRLRARLPFGLPDRHAVAGAPFVTEQRVAAEAHAADYPLELPSSTAPAQRFVAAARGVRGLVLLAPGHFEHEWTTAGDLLFTALRSVGQLSRDDLSTRPGHAGWPTAVPDAQCLGRDRIELAIAPITEAGLANGAPHRLWEDAFLSPRGRWLRDATRLNPAPVSIELEGAGLALSAVKPAEDGDGLILRCWNTGTVREGAWRIRPAIQEAWRVRADETMPEALVVTGGAVRFRAEAHEIVTIRVNWDPAHPGSHRPAV